jgi:hypothetical protein
MDTVKVATGHNATRDNTAINLLHAMVQKLEIPK